MSLPKELTTVTPVSKTVELIVLVAAMVIGFGIGVNYQETIDLLKQQRNYAASVYHQTSSLNPNVSRTPTGSAATASPASNGDRATWKTYIFGKVSLKYPPNYIVKTNGALGPVNIGDLNDTNRYMNIDISEKSNTEYNDLINSYITNAAFSNIRKELIQNGILITADGPGYPKKALWVIAFLRKNNTTIYIENTGYDVPKNIFDQILSTFKFTQ